MIPDNFKEPMLASPLKNGAMPVFPCLASPKLDGVRAEVFNGTVYSRKLKKIPNHFTQAVIGSPLLHAVDGELIVGSPTADDVFRVTSSAVMSSAECPDVKLYVFDMFLPTLGFTERLNALRDKLSRLPKGLRERVVVVDQVLINSAEELTAYEEKCLSEGYEGAMVRSLNGPYKCGRSTVREGYLLKVKRFCDSEAEILGLIELEHNLNTATKNELGRTKRSSHKAGRVGGGTLGALHGRDVKTGVEFQCGTGFTDEEKARLWGLGASLVGKKFKYSYFPTGSKEKPRFPVYLGIRDDID